jgi:hypothetical protein
MNSGVATPILAPGVTLAIEEVDYCYGRGLLLLRLNTISVNVSTLWKLHWVSLAGDVLCHDTGAVSERNREVLVRVSSLPMARRPVGWLPTSDRIFPEAEHGSRAWSGEGQSNCGELRAGLLAVWETDP